MEYAVIIQPQCRHVKNITITPACLYKFISLELFMDALNTCLTQKLVFSKLSPVDRQRVIDLYDAEIYYTDEQVGRIQPKPS